MSYKVSIEDQLLGDALRDSKKLMRNDVLSYQVSIEDQLSDVALRDREKLMRIIISVVEEELQDYSYVTSFAGSLLCLVSSNNYYELADSYMQQRRDLYAPDRNTLKILGAE